MFAVFQDELEVRKSLRAFCLRPKSLLNILRNLFFESAVKKCLKAFYTSSKTIIAQAYQSRCCFWRSSSVPESLETFQLSYASSNGKWVSSFLKTMSSEIGFPMTLRSSAFVNKKRNKPTSHELQNNLDSSCISTCTSSRKSRFKTSQDNTKLCQLQLSVSKFPHAQKFSAWTHLSSFDQSEHKNWTESVINAWPTRDSEKNQKRLPSLHVKAGWIFASEVISKSIF